MGATSGDVNTGLGKPAPGQRSEGEKRSQAQGEGGSGMQGGDSVEARALQSDHSQGTKSGQEHNVSLDGAETKESVGASEVAAMGQGSRKEDYDRSSYSAKGGPNA